VPVSEALAALIVVQPVSEVATLAYFPGVGPNGAGSQDWPAKPNR